MTVLGTDGPAHPGRRLKTGRDSCFTYEVLDL
jgi:hypothetical protein